MGRGSRDQKTSGNHKKRRTVPEIKRLVKKERKPGERVLYPNPTRGRLKTRERLEFPGKSHIRGKPQRKI